MGAPDRTMMWTNVAAEKEILRVKLGISAAAQAAITRV